MYFFSPYLSLILNQSRDETRINLITISYLILLWLLVIIQRQTAFYHRILFVTITTHFFFFFFIKCNNMNLNFLVKTVTSSFLGTVFFCKNIFLFCVSFIEKTLSLCCDFIHIYRLTFHWSEVTHCEHSCVKFLSASLPKITRSYLSQNVIIDCKSKVGGKKKSFELQERGTALKNKGDRWQYINFMRMKKKIN